MKKKYRIKKSAKNEFSALTGILAIQQQGGSNCLLVAQKTLAKPHFDRDIPIQKAAYCLYNRVAPSSIAKLTSTCDVSNCVAPSHLQVEMIPSEQEGYNPALDGWK